MDLFNDAFSVIHAQIAPFPESAFMNGRNDD